MSSVLPREPLYGHYSCKQQLYTVHSGSSDIVLRTPSPQEAPVIDMSTIIPRFRQPRYLSINFPYLLFIPKRYAWRDPFFKALDCPFDKLPIIQDGDDGFCLHPDVADTWLELEGCLRAVGRAMIELAPQRWLSTIVNPWFFPARFQFLHKFRSENAARFAAWRSIENFLPLLGYVSMGIWCMHGWEYAERERLADKDPPNWRLKVTTKADVHPTFLDYLEKAVKWGEERVGALYRIQDSTDLRPEEREQRAQIEWMLSGILQTKFPIPVYLSWGELPQQICMHQVPKAFHDYVPDARELERLASLRGEVKFSRWAVDDVSGVWRPDPYTPVAVAPTPHILSNNEETAPFSPIPSNSEETAPFPPRPPHSEQKENETIHAFFARRREGNMKKMAKETPTDRQRRTQRAENAAKGNVPKKACVFVWEKQDGHYIRQPATRGNFADLWHEFSGPQRRYDPIHNQWDLCELFEKNDPIFGQGYDHPNDDTDDDMDFEHPDLPPKHRHGITITSGGVPT
ncbi:hypothetical protein B0H11DRAFT_1937636 [Mycena galericulata]|nr:hypothetical protein B0H11DRAFT_1937636 [Mycena galericulata]